MARQPTPLGSGTAGGSAFGHVVLVAGPEGLLADRAVTDRLSAARAEEPEVDVNDVEAGRLDFGSLAELTSGSLFASRQISVIRDLASLPDDLSDPVVSLATGPIPDAAVILVHGGGIKGKALLDRLKKTGIEVVDCPQVKPWELPQFVSAEVRRGNGRIDADAAQFLVDAVGHDLRSLAGAVSQLLSDSETAGNGAPEVTLSLIKRYFGGRSEVTSFAVADAALAGRATVALEQLRWALATGVAPVLVTSALASSLRRVAKLLDAPPGMRDNDLARVIGAPPTQLKRLRGQSRGWDARGLATAIRLIAQADADVKGAAADAGFALEHAVLGVTRARGGQRQRS